MREVIINVFDIIELKNNFDKGFKRAYNDYLEHCKYTNQNKDSLKDFIDYSISNNCYYHSNGLIWID